jgi:hypothetical protein
MCEYLRCGVMSATEGMERWLALDVSKGPYYVRYRGIPHVRLKQTGGCTNLATARSTYVSSERVGVMRPSLPLLPPCDDDIGGGRIELEGFIS